MAHAFDIKNLVPEEYSGFKIYTQKETRRYGSSHLEKYHVKILKDGRTVHDEVAGINMYGIDNYGELTKDDVVRAAKKIIDDKLQGGIDVPKVGDLFYHSWGYDQTNYDFCIITAVSPSGATVKARMTVPVSGGEHGFMLEDLTPTSRTNGPEFQLKVHYYDGRIVLRGTYPHVMSSGSVGYTQRGSFYRVESGRKYTASHYA